MEVGVPVNSSVSKNTEFVPKVFNDLRVGDHFTLQSIFGYSTLFGGGDNGGLQTFESGFVFGCTLQHNEFPIPGVQQFIPMFELVGETAMNQDDSGQTSLTGNACFRANLNAIGSVQPLLGLGFVFPMNNNAREDVHWGIVTSLVFEYRKHFHQPQTIFAPNGGSTTAPSNEKIVNAGTVSNYAADGIYANFRDDGFFVIRQNGKLFALSSICTHRKCKLTSKPDHSFYCKCHGSTFNPAGHVTEGPARRDLPMLATITNANGQLVVKLPVM